MAKSKRSAVELVDGASQPLRDDRCAAAARDESDADEYQMGSDSADEIDFALREKQRLSCSTVLFAEESLLRLEALACSSYASRLRSTSFQAWRTKMFRRHRQRLRLACARLAEQTSQNNNTARTTKEGHSHSELWRQAHQIRAHVKPALAERIFPSLATNRLFTPLVVAPLVERQAASRVGQDAPKDGGIQKEELATPPVAASDGQTTSLATSPILREASTAQRPDPHVGMVESPRFAPAASKRERKRRHRDAEAIWALEADTVAFQSWAKPSPPFAESGVRITPQRKSSTCWSDSLREKERDLRREIRMVLWRELPLRRNAGDVEGYTTIARTLSERTHSYAASL